MWKNVSIGTKLVLIILGVNAVVLLVIGIIATTSSNSTLRNQAINRFATKNAEAVNSINLRLQEVAETAMLLANRLGVTSDLNESSALRAYVSRFLQTNSHPLIYRYNILRPDGSVAMMNVPNPATMDNNAWRIWRQPSEVPDDTVLQNVLRNGNQAWFYQAETYFDSQNMPSISLAVQYKNPEGEGVLWVDVPLAVFQMDVGHILIDEGLLAETIGGYSLLVDTEGHLLALYNLPETDTVAQNLASLTNELLARLEAAQAMTTGLFPLTDPYSQQDVLITQSRLMNHWLFLSAMPVNEIPVLPVQIFAPILLVSLLGLAILFEITLRMVGRSVVRPLMRLSAAAAEIGSGDLRQRIIYQERRDEIGQLARALEAMKTNLSHSYDELSRWSRTLEDRVNVRTRELDAALNKADATAAELRAVYDESLLVVREAQLRPVLNAFVNRILTLLDASYCGVWLLNDERDKLQLVASSDISYQNQTITIHRDEGLAGQTVLFGTPIVVEDYLQYPHRTLSMYGDKPAPFQKAIAVPLMFVGRAIGAVVVGRPGSAFSFTEKDERLLTLFANLVSPSVRNAQLFVQLNEAVFDAERANQVKTRFLASVTHELRTPLNLIINNMDFMRIGAFGAVTEEQVTRLNQTVRSAEHLLYLINDLLDVSKIDAGAMQLFKQPADVYTMLEDVIDTTQSLLEKLDYRRDHVEFVADIDEGIPELVIDARRMRQVLTNLLSNAVKFTMSGTVLLRVTREAAGVRFSVTDTGMGIPEEEMPKLFAAFERTHQAREHNIEGTGLGLPISQYLVQQHGGEIQVESIPGKGSTFWFVLPYSHTDAPANSKKTDTQILTILTSNSR